MTITVSPVNDAPVAADDVASTNEDTQVTVAAPGVLGNDTDVEGDVLSAAVVTGPTHAADFHLLANGSFDYTPAANFNGTDTFTYQANDGTDTSNLATVTITVNSVNDAPVAIDDVASTNEDTPLNVTAPGVLANDTDTEGSPLTATLVSPPTSSSAFIFNADGSYDYTPNPNFNGTDSFTYKANDGSADSNTVTVTITVVPQNDAPVAAADTYATDEDAPLTVGAAGVLGNDTDTEGSALIASEVSGPTHTAIFTLHADGSFDYTPTANYNGSDSFTYKANDGTDNSNTVTVTITVNAVADTPVAVADSPAPVVEDSAATTFDVLANDSDADNLTGPANAGLSVASATNGAHGTVAVALDGSSLSYTPNPNFNGTDSFTYTVTDGALTDITTVSVTVSPVADAPVANADSATVVEDDSATTVDVLANDTDADNLSGPANAGLTVSSTTPASHGTVTVAGDGLSVRYTPAADYNGPDSFSYTVTDGALTSTATVSMTVTAANDAPVGHGDSATLAEDSQDFPIDVLANDTDADNLTGAPNAGLAVSHVSDPAHGSAAFSAAGATYTPNPDFYGTDSFTYTVTDGVLSDTATVSVTVSPVADAPVAQADTATVGEDDSATTVDLLANDTDADNLSGPANAGLTVSATTPASHGTVAIALDGLSVTYTPAANYNGPDSFTYTVNDGGLTATATVSITVDRGERCPVATGDAFSTDEDTTLTVAAPGVLAQRHGRRRRPAVGGAGG